MTNDDASQRLLQSFTSMDELASYLAVPEKALYCVEISKAKERHAGRPSAFTPSLNRNNGWCCFHSQTWYRRKPKHGHKLLGPSFMHPVDGTRKKTRKTCCCDLPECKGIGYAHNMFGILAEPPHVVDDLINALNIKVGDKKEAIQKDPGVFCVAPWHFHPSQMIHNEHEGWWILTRNHSYMLTAGKCVFVDEDRKK